MGRRDLTIYGLLGLLGLGGTALVAGLTATTNAFTPFLLWGGLGAITVSLGGLGRMFMTAPKAADLIAPPREPEREFLPPEITAAVLREKAAGRTSVQIDAITKTYAGKWLRHEGQIRDVWEVFGGEWSALITDGGRSTTMSARFSKEWQDRLISLNIGDWVTVEGEVHRLNSGVSLKGSSLIHVGKTPTVPKKTRPRPKRAAPEDPSSQSA